MSCSSQGIFCLCMSSGSKTYRPISSSHEQVGQTQKTKNEMLTESLHFRRLLVSSLLWLEFQTYHKTRLGLDFRLELEF